jgi:hypothetical protein
MITPLGVSRYMKPGGSGGEMNVKEHIKGQVRFQYYRDGSLYYKTEFTDLTFPVPITDVGNATFLAEDKGILFMRWIRKFLTGVGDPAEHGNAD